MELSSHEWQAIRLSIWVASCSVLVILPFGIPTAWLLARRTFRGKSIVETMVNLPLVVPPVVTGYLLLVTFGAQGVFGRWLHEWFGIRVVFDWKGAALASAVMAFPLFVRACRIAFASVDPRLEAAARTLGAGRLDSFLSITVPMAWHGILAGLVLAFARSIGEFGATIMVAGSIPGRTRTIPLEIFHLLESPGGMARVRVLIIASVLIGCLALLVSEMLERRHRLRVGEPFV